VSNAFPADKRAAAIGLWSGIGATGSAIGPFVAGVIFQSVSAGSPYVTGAALAVASAALALRLQNRA